MISQNWIDKLNNDEVILLYGITNIINPQPFGMEVDMNLIKYYKTHILQEKIKNSKDKIKDEYLPVWSGLCDKFEVK